MEHRIVVRWTDPVDEGSATEAVLKATTLLMEMIGDLAIEVREDLFCGDEAESV